MKKRSLKNLTLNKSSVSNLNGGGGEADPNPTFTGPSITILNSHICTDWCSELFTACHCETLQETCPIDCESIHNPFEM